MKICLTIVLALDSVVAARDYKVASLSEIGASVKKEDESYWNRLMQQTEMSVAPTPRLPTPPVPTEPAPTEGPSPPTPSPVNPTPAPKEPTASPTATPPTNEAPTPGPPSAASTPTDASPTEAPQTGEPPTNAPPTNPLPTELAPTEPAPTEPVFPPTLAPIDTTPAPVESTPSPIAAPPTNTAPTPRPPSATTPTDAPGGICEVAVGVTCTTSDGAECNEFSIPTLSCATGLSDITLRYTGGDCASESNQQPDSVCADILSLILTEEVVLVSCYDNEEVLSQAEVRIGDEFSVLGTPLPDTVNCVVTSLDEAIVYQDVTFSLVNGFTLKSSFGSLLVEQCGDLDCIVNVTYEYTTTNVGTEPLEIISFERTRNEETVDLIDLVDRMSIGAGESTITQEPDVVDYCVASSISTDVAVFADGEQCIEIGDRNGMLRASSGASAPSNSYLLHIVEP